jgi:hypothetical protein
VEVVDEVVGVAVDEAGAERQRRQQRQQQQQQQRPTRLRRRAR